ncbi:unnamed protein product, partial [Chrysoparadoxa australica]
MPGVLPGAGARRNSLGPLPLRQGQLPAGVMAGPPPRGPPQAQLAVRRGSTGSAVPGRMSAANILSQRRPSFAAYDPQQMQKARQGQPELPLPANLASLPLRRFSITQEAPAVQGSTNLSRRMSMGPTSAAPPDPGPSDDTTGLSVVQCYNLGVSRQKEGKLQSAAALYAKAAQQLHPKACHNLAALYEKGAGVVKDDAEAVRLFHTAADAEANLSESCYSLAMHYKFGLGVEADDARCVYYLEKASVEGLAKAMFNLGLMYEKRRGVDPAVPVPDLLQAAKECYQAAASAGLSKAAINLGVLYLTRRLPGARPEAAFRWFKQAADEGDASALWNLSLCYARGIGVEKDEDKAQKLREQCEAQEKNSPPSKSGEASVEEQPQGEEGTQEPKDVTDQGAQICEEKASSVPAQEAALRAVPVPSGPPPPGVPVVGVHAQKRRDSLKLRPTPEAIARVKAAVEARRKRE